MEGAVLAPEELFKVNAQTLIAPTPLDVHALRALVLARLKLYRQLLAEGVFLVLPRQRDLPKACIIRDRLSPASIFRSECAVRLSHT